jgi:signal transduction histidine kinase
LRFRAGIATLKASSIHSSRKALPAMRWSIRYQLLVPVLILLLGVVGISTWTALASANRARDQIEAHVRAIARTVEERTFPHEEAILEVMRGLSGAELLVDDPMLGAFSTFAEKPALSDLPVAADDARALRLGPRVTVAGQTYLCSGTRIRRRSGVTFTLYIFYPESLLEDAIWGAVRPSLILGSFGGLAAIVLAVGVAQRLGRRVQELERRTRLIAAGDFSSMPLPGRNDELRDLGRSVNDMAQRLAQLQEAVQKTERFRLLGQVSGGLAHQLRNGVTGARLAVQVHARECGGNADAEALQVALRQLALVESHLKKFLELGKGASLERKAHSLAAVLEEAIALIGPQCRHAQIDLRWQAPAEALPIRGDASQLGHLFLNVIGNAVEAAGPGGAVEVQVAIKDGKRENGREEAASRTAAIEIWDSGPGPPPEVAQRLFEPFVTGKPEGVGLGLAVGRQVAEAHGGSISWRREDGRTCFHIELPLDFAVAAWKPLAPEYRGEGLG